MSSGQIKQRFRLRFRSRSLVVGLFLLLQLAPLLALTLGAPSLLVLGLSVGILLCTMPLVLGGMQSIDRTIDLLVQDTQKIRQMDFSGELPPASLFAEIETLNRNHIEMKDALQSQTQALQASQLKLASLVENGLLLSSERDRDALLRHILMQGKRTCNAQAATMYLKTEHGTLRFALRSMDDELPTVEIPLHDPHTGLPNERHVSTYAALHNETVVIDDVYGESRFDLSGTRRFDSESGFHTVSMLTVPLAPRGGEVIGVLQFMNALDVETGEVIAFSPPVVAFIGALASQAAVALENHNLIDSQRALIDGMIEILAGAIDAKSPYTGAHCERVPELAMMLAEAASEVNEGPLANFRFTTADEWREFRIGAWLHDCGKITTPEHVVDKATKLETIYNRIHEVRMRFEVLLRDAQLERLQQLLDGQDRAQADAQYQATAQALQDEFAFIAGCNIGSELMNPEHVGTLQKAAERTWLRHFDDRLGLSHGELMHMAALPAEPLPARERLLADKPQHIFPRPQTKDFDPKYGFQISVPEHLYNHGELYNLSISKGTLTAEERFKINEHIIQTIVMLENLPLPSNLKRVPEYAGTHHETLLGTGYPRKLDKSQLSIPARIMAIADIFEALTAADRPYKQAKTLSESIEILARLRDKGHIDADLFALFLRSEMPMRYAERHLQPEQIDAIDIERFVPTAQAVI
ncbi:HD domain-containing phosphohydrolase [Pseudomonas sp. PDM11]|uniref:HD domain-containing phosphohydrolase n=1 Tax=Pseudomonas sp. PDM11 TaxID=2769309 RepID=UPI0017821F1E|nr:HD domain-containing phosphohydrolase [Pseudomonas sp. PDM11]MBD9397431.1 GAF domain-containing protein [Pseudomonas sp. PDM11]